MNERINELRLEAGISRLHEVPYMVAVNKEGEIIEPLDGLQKFAELIVNQCADIAQQHNKSPVAAPLAIGYVIREHFGVEE
jgi:hypothetical protein